METLSAIPIQSPFIEMILSKRKKWEIRSKNTIKRGLVALIKSRSGTVVGTAVLSDAILITRKMVSDVTNIKRMGLPVNGAKYALGAVGQYAWVLKGVVKFKEPVKYKHPSGAVTWVTLAGATKRKVLEEAERSKKK
jgi:hypothetical protein